MPNPLHEDLRELNAIQRPCEVCAEPATVVVSDVYKYGIGGHEFYAPAISRTPHYYCQLHKKEAEVVEPTGADIDAFERHFERSI